MMDYLVNWYGLDHAVLPILLPCYVIWVGYLPLLLGPNPAHKRCSYCGDCV